MASQPFDIVTYIPPGTYISETISSGGLNIAGLPFAVALLGTGDRNKTVSNEAIQRGLVAGESLSPASMSPHTATLVNRGDRDLGNTTVNRTVGGITTEIPPGLLSYLSAVITGSTAGPFNVSVNNAMALDLDGQDPVTLAFYTRQTLVTSAIAFGTWTGGTVYSGPFRIPSGSVTLTLTQTATTLTGSPITVTVVGTDGAGAPQTGTFLTVASGSGTTNLSQGALTWSSISTITLGGAITAGSISFGTLADAVAIQGQQISTGTALTSSGTAATRADIAAAINLALTNASSLGFGSAYSAAASDATTGVRITSQVSTPQSDVRVFVAPAQSATSTLFGSAFVNAPTIIQISDQAWSSTATWSIDYVFDSDVVLYPSAAIVQDNIDDLANSNVQGVSAVGSFAGAGNFQQGRDWQLVGDTLDWSVDTAAIFNTGPAPASFALTGGGTSAQVTLSIDGQAATTFDLVSQANYPLGYAVIGSPATASASAIAANINAMLAQAYGPRYDSVASASSGRVILTSPTQGVISSITISSPSSGSAVATVFGVTSTTVLGTGYRPASGAVYFATYSFTRPDADYNKPFNFFDVTSAKAQVGQVSTDVVLYNPLAKGIELAFANGAPQIYLIQIDDSTAPGTPTRNQVDEALLAAEMLDAMTEVILVDQPGTELANTVDLVNHVETESSPTVKHYRRGHFGMAVNTAPGDVNTSGTFIYEAVNTLQVAATSPGRGRMFLWAPPQQAGVSRDYTLTDGSTARLSLDSTYIAIAGASLRTALLSPADTLVNLTLQGFNIDDITAPWRQAEINAMASKGVCVASFVGGQIVLKDPKTTEAGGGGLLEFSQDSASYQKDNVVRQITQALDDNIVGIVPFDLANFLIDIKQVIVSVLSNAVSAGAIGPYRDQNGATRAISMQTDVGVQQSPTDPTKYFFVFAFNLRYPALRLLGTYSVDNPWASLNGQAAA